MFGFITAFVPWIVYWILVGNSSYLIAVSVAFGVSIVLEAIQFMRQRHLGSLEIGGLVFFALSFVSAFLVDDALVEEWLQPLSNGALFVIALVGVLIGRPFVRDAARSTVDAQTAATDGFRYITTAMTWMWVAVFGLMTISSLIPPLVQGSATIRDGASTLSIVCYWIIPFAFFGIAGAISAIFPGWFDSATKRLDAREAQAQALAQAQPAVSSAGRGAAAPSGSGGAGAARVSPAPDLASSGVRVEAPADSLHSEPLPVVVSGLAPGRSVELRSSARDLLGRRWAASAVFTVPEDGRLDLAAVAPGPGDWTAAEQLGLGGRVLVTALRFAEEGQVPELFLPPAEPLALTIEVVDAGVARDRPAHASTAEGALLARRTITRSPASAGVRVAEVDVEGLTGLLALPAGQTPAGGHPAIACFGGSEGGVDSLRLTASLLASAGYAALVTAWTDSDADGNAVIARIPLERFGTAVEWLRRHEATDSARVAALGLSRGAEGLLAALAAGRAEASAVVALSPSSVRWQAVGGGGEQAGVGSWTVGDAEAAWLPVRTGELVPQLVRNGWRLGRQEAQHAPTLLRLRPAYEAGLRHAGAAERAAAAIDGGAIAAPILFAAGEDDAVWPGPEMAAELADARDRPDDVRAVYPRAGHLLRLGSLPTDALWTGGIALGGSRAEHAIAEAALWAEVVGFLERALA